MVRRVSVGRNLCISQVHITGYISQMSTSQKFFLLTLTKTVIPIYRIFMKINISLFKNNKHNIFH